MTDTEMAVIQRGNTEELRALVFLKDAQCAEKDKTIEWQRKMLEQRLDDIQKDIADAADDVCETVGEERKPPTPKDVDATSRRDLYNLAKRITEKRGDLGGFMGKTTWRFRGYTPREIYGDVCGLRTFMNTERMAIKRERPDQD